MLENLKELVSINSYDSEDKIIEYLFKRFSNFSDDVKIVFNKEDQKKSLIIGLNTKLKDVIINTNVAPKYVKILYLSVRFLSPLNSFEIIISNGATSANVINKKQTALATVIFSP